MVQALAFAEIFLGLILADAGYKGVTISAVIQGRVENAKPKGLGEGSSETVFATSGEAAGATPSTGGAIGDVTPESEAEAVAKGELLPAKVAMTPQEAARNKAFGPQPINSPNALFGTAGDSP